MKRLFFFLVVASIVACAPVSEKPDRISEMEIKLTRLEENQKNLKENIDRTNERIDRLTELISELRLELERIKLKLLTGVPEHESLPKEGSEVVRVEPKKLPPPEELKSSKEEGKKVEEEKPEEDAETAYKKAIELYSVKKLYEARDAFLDFIRRFPENKYTDNAFFWIGKIYQELGDPKRAEEIYTSLAQKCEKGKLPDCNKLPDAYYQLMRISLDRGDVAKANEYYSILIERFPTSDAAVRAREQKVLMGE